MPFISDIKSIKVVEKKLVPNGGLVFNDYIQKFVSNYLVSWGLHNDNTLNIFLRANPPIQLEAVSKIHRGYVLGGPNNIRKVIGNAWEASTPQNVKDLTGILDIDGEHVHGLAVLNNGTITGWTKTGDTYAMGARAWVTENQGALWRQSRHAVTGGRFLTGVKKIGADFQASFALLSGDILTGWGNMGETWINPGYTSVGRGPYVYFIDENNHSKKWKAFSFNYNLSFQPASVKWNWYKNGIACYESGNATHVVSTYFEDWNAEHQPELRGLSWLPTESGKFSSYVSSNYQLSVLTVSGGDNRITTSGSAQRNNNNPYERVVIGGPTKSWVGGFMYVKPSRDIYYNPTLWNLPTIAQNPQTSGFGIKTILLENDGDIWVSTDTGFKNWSTKGINKKWLGLAYNAGASVSFRSPITNILVSDNFTYGKYITAFTDSGYLWVSNDTGETWAQKGPLQNWSCVAISSGGKYQIAGTRSGYLWKSEDYGENWSQITNLGIKQWKSVSLSGPSKDWVGKFDTGRKYIDSASSEAKYISAASANDFSVSYDSGLNWYSKFNTSTFSLNNAVVPTPINIIGGEGYTIIPDSGLMFIANNLGTDGYYTGPASPQIPFASYPNIYLTGVQDFDIGENYISILLKNGSSDSYTLSGWGDMRPARLRSGDNLQNVKKVISTTDHTFVLLKSGNTSYLSGWGLDPQNQSQFEEWLWSYYGGMSGWFSSFLTGTRGWTGIKDFDIGYNHGIAVFEDDRASGWGGEKPLEVKGLIGQINNRYKNVNEKEINFYLDTPSFVGNEISYYTDTSDWVIKFNQGMDRWVLQLPTPSGNKIAYRAKTEGSGGLIGSWEGLAFEGGSDNYAGQELEVTNATVQSIYPPEVGEAYISAVGDQDWIKVANENLNFTWNKTVAYAGNSVINLNLINFPSSVYHQNGRASFDNGNIQQLIPNTYGKNWITGRNNNLNYQGIAISSDGKYQTAVVDGGYIYTSFDSGASWVQRAFPSNWRSVACHRDGNLQVAIERSGIQTGKLWVSLDYGSSWGYPGGASDSSRTGYWNSVSINDDGTVFVFPDSGRIKASWDIQSNVWEEASGFWSDDDGGGIDIWTAGAISPYYHATLIRRKTPLLISNDGVNFFEALDIPQTADWRSTAMSDDGKYRIVTTSGYGVWSSFDSGVSWYALQSMLPSRDYSSAAMSRDGRYQTVVAKNSSFSWHSNNYGLSWGVTSLGVRNWSSAAVSASGEIIAVVASTGLTTSTVSPISTGAIFRSLTESEITPSVRLYPTTDYPLTVYREISGAKSSDSMLAEKMHEIFLYQSNDKTASWNINLRFRGPDGSFSDETLVSNRKSLDQPGTPLPPTGVWSDFYTRITSGTNSLKNQLNSGFSLQATLKPNFLLTDTRTGYMQDVRFSLDYSKMLPNYSNPSQVYRDIDGNVDYSLFGADITVEDADIGNWIFNQNNLIESNRSFQINVARFSQDIGVNWNKTIWNPLCGPDFNSTNNYDLLSNNPTMPLRSWGANWGNQWYILLKCFLTGWNSTGAYDKFTWKMPYLFDKNSNTQAPFRAELYNMAFGTWSGLVDNQQIEIWSGTCYHLQVRLSHPYINSGQSYPSTNERNIWPLLSTTGRYLGSYLWNGIESATTNLSSPKPWADLSLQRGREYRFIQQGPITNKNKLTIYPTEGVEVFEYDSSNPSDYNYIQVKINSEGSGDQEILWSKGDRSYFKDYILIPGTTPSMGAGPRGPYTIGNFYERDITGIIPDPNRPNFVKYANNTVTGQWYINRSGSNKATGILRFLDKLYPAEFWYLSGGTSFNTWPDNLSDNSKISTAYAFINSGNTKIPFYGIMTQTARNIDLFATNSSGYYANTKNLWNGTFDIIGKNNFSMASNFEIPDYPLPGQMTSYDMNICTDYDMANDSSTWSFLSRPLSERSGISFFSGINSTGYLFKNRWNRFYTRKAILAERGSISNIVFVPPTQARLSANQIAFWTGSTQNGPWAEVTGQERSIWGGTSNFWNINSYTYPDPSINQTFGEVWQIIQIYIPTTINSPVYAKFGPKSLGPNCTTGCSRYTDFSIIPKFGLRDIHASGYYQKRPWATEIQLDRVNYSKIVKPVFKGNLNIWSSDPYYIKQIPLEFTGAVDYINY